MDEPQYDFFLSHNRAETAWVAGLAAALRKQGVRVFFDEDSIRLGEDIVAAIGRGLSSSKYVAVILSKQSVQSRWVELEWASSLHEDVESSSNRLLPLLVEECEIPLVLRRLKHFDLRNVTPEQCAVRLLDHLRKQGDRDAQPQPFPIVPPASAVVEQGRLRLVALADFAPDALLALIQALVAAAGKASRGESVEDIHLVLGDGRRAWVEVNRAGFDTWGAVPGLDSILRRVIGHRDQIDYYKQQKLGPYAAGVNYDRLVAEQAAELTKSIAEMVDRLRPFVRAVRCAE